MALFDGVEAVCGKLSGKGWGALLKKKHGLDISKSGNALKTELAKTVTVDRSQPGFEDFALEGQRGIEPGKPARSLLYHALASCNVLLGEDGATELQEYPTLADIEAVENYVFGIQPPAISHIRTIAGNSPLAICVFAYEYRPAHETVHRAHADLCFSRTGLARVGDAAPIYDAKARGFLPFVDNDKHKIRVLPVRFGAFLGVELKGSAGGFGPMRSQDDDAAREFWVPLQKLFSGTECIRNFDLDVKLDLGLLNEKLRRLHQAWAPDTKWKEPEISEFPFRITDDIASFSKTAGHGTGLMMPKPHKLVEVAKLKNGKRVTYRVPPSSDTISSSLYLPGSGNSRPVPEFVHARHKVNANGSITDLNARPDVAAAVAAGGYDALHYIDWTADGWAEASCTQLATDIPRRVPAYALVTAPDFFVHCDQRELLEWTQQSVRAELAHSLWSTPPNTLCDERIPPNLHFEGKFVREDETATAIVTLLDSGGARTGADSVPDTVRHSWLPDAGSSLYDPGWDVSRDVSHGRLHLAVYGLGSPFPEDAKLCAALSTFWPAVAPDTARVFQPNAIGDAPTVAPLTDEEIGIGGTPWDGVPGPKQVNAGGETMVEYHRFDNVDYVQNALEGLFSLRATGEVETREYQRRVHSMARSYRVLGTLGGSFNSEIRRKASWSVLSFKKLTKKSPELKGAETATSRTLTMPIYRVETYKHGAEVDHPTDGKKVRVAMGQRAVMFVDGMQILHQRTGSNWNGESDV